MIKDTIVTKGYDKIYSAIADSEIINYELTNGVSTTSYANGIKVYVNHTNSKKASPAGELAPYGFSMS